MDTIWKRFTEPVLSMMNKEKTLFIFEGARTEDKFVEKLELNFLGKGHAIKCVYDAEIYQLYRAIKNEGDLFLDIVTLLKERSNENAKILEEYSRDSFAYVYLFFDYDAHSTLADDKKITEMLSFFNDETENGMLYISYPMVEAIRHYKDMESFRTLTVKCKRNNCPYINDCKDAPVCLHEPHYKQFATTDSKPQLANINSYNKSVWQELITAHLSKANYLVNDVYVLPSSLMDQVSIFTKQQEKHINKKCPEVAVLSAFPLYVLDYYGIERIIKKLEA